MCEFIKLFDKKKLNNQDSHNENSMLSSICGGPGAAAHYDYTHA